MESTIQSDPRFSKAYEKSEDFRLLSEEHIRLKREASEFNRAKYLTPEQEARMHQIKKRKLEIKDKLESIMRHYSS
ncbi:MAG: DUF465 domain-containing protein [Nitrospinota bacterium]